MMRFTDKVNIPERTILGSSLLHTFSCIHLPRRDHVFRDRPPQILRREDLALRPPSSIHGFISSVCFTLSRILHPPSGSSVTSNHVCTPGQSDSRTR